MEKVTDKSGKEYIKSGYFCFNVGTNHKVMEIINNLYDTKRRVRLFYGKDGKVWNESYDTTGHIGRSTGTFQIPLLIRTSRSYGGGALLDDCIVKIVDIKTKRVLYEAENYKADTFTNENENILCNGEYWGKNKNAASAKRFCAFMNGERMGL